MAAVPYARPRHGTRMVTVESAGGRRGEGSVLSPLVSACALPRAPPVERHRSAATPKVAPMASSASSLGVWVCRSRRGRPGALARGGWRLCSVCGTPLARPCGHPTHASGVACVGCTPQLGRLRSATCSTKMAPNGTRSRHHSGTSQSACSPGAAIGAHRLGHASLASARH